MKDFFNWHTICGLALVLSASLLAAFRQHALKASRKIGAVTVSLNELKVIVFLGFGGGIILILSGTAALIAFPQLLVGIFLLVAGLIGVGGIFKATRAGVIDSMGKLRPPVLRKQSPFEFQVTVLFFSLIILLLLGAGGLIIYVHLQKVGA